MVHQDYVRTFRIFNMIKYWCKLLNTDNCILIFFNLHMYKRAEYKTTDNWAFHIKHELNKLGFSDVWTSQQLDPLYLPIIKTKINRPSCL